MAEDAILGDEGGHPKGLQGEAGFGCLLRRDLSGDLGNHGIDTIGSRWKLLSFGLVDEFQFGQHLGETHARGEVPATIAESASKVRLVGSRQ